MPSPAREPTFARPSRPPRASARVTVRSTTPSRSNQTSARRHGLAGRPFAGLGQRNEVPDLAIEGVGLLDVHGVASLGEYGEAGIGQDFLEPQAGLQAGLVLVAADDQGRHAELLPLGLEVIKRRPLALVLRHGVGGAGVGMLRQVLHELGEAARVLLLEARAGGIAD